MKRVDIKTGFLCNNNCRFCVQANNKCKGNRSFEEIKQDLEDSRKRCEGVVFTGGEVTIRKDFIGLVGLAKELGYKIIPDTEIRGKEHQNTNDYTKQRIKEGKVKFEQCKECKYDSVCEGPWKEYPDKKGNDEFKVVRLNIKYKKGEEKDYLHTLNSTAVATSRAIRTIIENYQQKDGSVAVPKVLLPYMNGIKVI